MLKRRTASVVHPFPARPSGAFNRIWTKHEVRTPKRAENARGLTCCCRSPRRQLHENGKAALHSIFLVRAPPPIRRTECTAANCRWGHRPHSTCKAKEKPNPTAPASVTASASIWSGFAFATIDAQGRERFFETTNAHESTRMRVGLARSKAERRVRKPHSKTQLASLPGPSTGRVQPGLSLLAPLRSKTPFMVRPRVGIRLCSQVSV